MTAFRQAIDAVESFSSPRIEGRVSSIRGLSLLAREFPAPLGAMCRVVPRFTEPIDAQVVGFHTGETVLMPLTDLGGIAPGDEVLCRHREQQVGVGPLLLGRVLDGMGRPIDGKGPLLPDTFYPLYRPAPKPLERLPVTEPIGTGVRAIDAMMTLGRGQRLGLFAGTGVGKSVLLGMIARDTAADVIVVALIGERGREVRDFLDKDLGEEGRKRAVVVVSTSDESPLRRTRACYVATAVAEYFRDQGANVLLLLDSLTRMAMAQRQIGLAAGEPPATKGYPPSAFAMLPPLCERCGRTDAGSITGLYTVLVEGDDLTDPVADAVRGILDGHVWLSRRLSSRAHWPAIDVLDSISRVMPDLVDDQHDAAARQIRRILATYAEIEDLVTIGAYAKGTTPQFDLAIEAKPLIDAFLCQGMAEPASYESVTQSLAQLDQRIRQLARKLGVASVPPPAATPAPAAAQIKE